MTNTDSILSRYKAGTHSTSDMEVIENMLILGALSLSDIDIVLKVNEAMDHQLDDAAVGRMDQDFYTSLDLRKDHFNNKWIAGLSVIILVLTALCFYLLGQLNAKQEIEPNLSPQMFASTLLDIDQVDQRIHLVTDLSKKDKLDDDLLDVLLYNLISDESTNVRLSSLNILKDYAESPLIRQGLINAIPFQESPIVLIYIKEAIAYSGIEMTSKDFAERVNESTKIAFDQSFKSISL